MPYKARVKAGKERKRQKTVYRVTNNHEYNISLKKRGMISLYFPSGDLKTQFINQAPYIEGVSGRETSYKTAYIELLFLFYRLHSWGMWQITGWMQDYWNIRGLDIPVPSFGHLSDCFAKLSVSIKQHCTHLAKRLAKGESIDLIIDSMGLSFGRASAWYETKYGKQPRVTPWRKMHRSIDAHMNINGLAITDVSVSDSSGMALVMPEQTFIGKLLADGAYYNSERNEALLAKGILPVIPPPIHAVVKGKADTPWHDQLVQYIKDKGMHAFREKYDYGKRALVETKIFCIKRCLGASLLTQKLASQANEGIIMANIMNLWNSFGRPMTVKIV